MDRTARHVAFEASTALRGEFDLEGEAGRESRGIQRFPTCPTESMVTVITQLGN